MNVTDAIHLDPAFEDFTEEEYYEQNEPRCTNPGGHEFKCTGTAYGGDDPRWCGEGRCLCVHCGADGDA